MTISAQIIADSVSLLGIRLPTIFARYPKFIHSELMTHRVFSRNASSSRAIPVGRLIEDIRTDPGMPIHWGRKQRGMQAREEQSAPVRDPFTGELVSKEEGWRRAREAQIAWAQAYDDAGYHKQIVNRRIENDGHISVLITSTDWANFFALRRHKDAQPEMRALAETIWVVMSDSRPVTLQHGEWHLPYVYDHEIEKYGGRADPALILRKISTARCARTSYKTHDGRVATVEEDIDLHRKLVESEPLHASPAEHQATPDLWGKALGWLNRNKHGNLTGWCQYRKSLANECVHDAGR